MTQQNQELEAARKIMHKWNKKRANDEKEGVANFYKLKSIFNQKSIKNAPPPTYQPKQADTNQPQSH